MKEKQTIISIFIAVLLVILGTVGILTNKNIQKIETKPTESDAQKMKKEYTELSKDNVFIYRSQKEMIKILENGTGIIYLGFPECKWCQQYIPYLNEVAKEEKLEKIYYLNILKDREDNTKEYQKIVSILKDYLQYDEEGNNRIYVPCVIAVEKGKIVGFDDETAWDTKGVEEPKEYWTEDRISSLKNKLTDMVKKTQAGICTDCNK